MLISNLHHNHTRPFYIKPLKNGDSELLKHQESFEYHLQRLVSELNSSYSTNDYSSTYNSSAEYNSPEISRASGSSFHATA